MDHGSPQGQHAQHIKGRGPRVDCQLVGAENQAGIEVLRDGAQLGRGGYVLPGKIQVEISQQLPRYESV
jgi:hypothetical protein